MNSEDTWEFVHVLVLKSFVKISEIREGMIYKVKDNVGMCLSIGGHMAPIISDVFMTF